MSFADIEKNIGELGQKAREGKITIEDLQGELLLLQMVELWINAFNPNIKSATSAVLGMHNIINRPTVINGNIEIRLYILLYLTITE